ncbi:DUF2939 domain-containing protein [Cupriavidus numazuensis]|uniref:DUF2939 domain-containing protein n=1 Tax=Cupriavidus numazuensis TaxID=221992 RepID=A0ABN7PXS5_9BURK|nr:DUF2939 domain-containing protein [Cupriavidus numazuensis]CAG2141311.1 hypothetical protein LMG26411_02032 [Cupriavidus numazuensis]
MAAAIAVIAIGAATSYASPYWTIYQMRSAIETHDAEKFSRYVDYPALRENLKGQLLSSLKGQMQSPALKDNPFAGLGQMIGLAMVNTIVDTMVSPAGVMALMAGEKPATRSPAPQSPAPAPEAPRKEAAKDALKYDVSYRSWTMVQATATKDNGDQIIADLRRDGLWSWKWVGIKIPGLGKMQ